MVKLRFTPSTLFLEGPHLEILISATRLELQEGRAVGLEFKELSVGALIDTGASLTIINPEIAAPASSSRRGTKKSMQSEEQQASIRSMPPQSLFPELSSRV